MILHTAFRSEAARAAALESYDRVLSRWPVPYESRFVETRFGRAHALISGDPSAMPVVLLHGGGGNATMWIHNVAALARGLRVHALDILGDVGKSEGARPSAASGYVDWLAETLDALGLDRAGLCGASFGAWLAAAYSRSQPARVSGLALLAPPNLGPPRTPFLLRAILATLLPGEGRVRKFYRYISSSRAPLPPEWALQDFVVRWRSQRKSPSPPAEMTEEELRALPEGTLLLLGEDEHLYDLDKALARLQAFAPQISVTVLPAAGHTLSVDQADGISARLLEHFAKRV